MFIRFIIHGGNKRGRRNNDEEEGVKRMMR